MGSRGRWRKNVPSSLSCQAVLSPTLLWRELLFRDDEDMVVSLVVGQAVGLWDVVLLATSLGMQRNEGAFKNR